MLGRLRKFWRLLGPGFVAGASDDDPSGIATYSQTGAQFGYAQLWSALWLYPLAGAVQEIAGRIGLVTGKGLMATLRTYYSRWILYFAVGLLVTANAVNVGADLGAMAATAKTLVGWGTLIGWMMILVFVILITQILVPYRTYSTYLKWVSLSLLAYVVVVIIVHQDWSQMAFSTFVPWNFQFNQAYVLNIVALCGTTITPYVIFWQADQEAEEDYRRGRVHAFALGVPKLEKHDIRDLRADTAIGMGFMEVIQWAIIAACAATLWRAGITDIQTPDQAAQALRPLAGDFTFALFAFGIIGIGMLAIPVMTGSAAQALTEAGGGRAGLSYSWREAPTFYGVIVAATMVGVLLNYVGLPPYKMLYYAAALNGVLAVPLLGMLTHVGNNRTVMGEHSNNMFSNIMGWLTCGIMGVCATALLYEIVLT